MEIAKKQNLNQAILIEQAQTQIKLLIRNNVLGGKGFAKLDKEVQTVINNTIKGLKSDQLRTETRNGLNMFADKVYRQFVADLGFNYSLIIGAVALMKKGTYTKQEIETLNQSIMKVQGNYEIGLPNQEFHKDYIDRVKVALNNMRQIEANSLTTGKSLRNLAEMETRFEKKQEQIQYLVDKGENLVVCSTHANCSERCQPWQGKHYTLNGETKFIDGINFIPLETATDIFVTTKSGKSYKNGLLGYNCRHFLTPYRKGEQIPHIKADVIDKEREIDQRMRQLERNVRQWKEERDLNQDIDKRRYLIAREKAIEWNKKYIQFAQDNNRAYYPDRVKII